MNKIVANLSAAALSLAAGTAHAAPARNVVLVHGAFTDQTSWNKVARLLRGKGFHVTEVANPTTSLEADVAAIRWPSTRPIPSRCAPRSRRAMS
jgi:hypothetical protein